MAPHPETTPVPKATDKAPDAPCRPCEDENGNPACHWHLRQRLSLQSDAENMWITRSCGHPRITIMSLDTLVVEECTAFDPITKEKSAGETNMMLAKIRINMRQQKNDINKAVDLLADVADYLFGLPEDEKQTKARMWLGEALALLVGATHADAPELLPEFKEIIDMDLSKGPYPRGATTKDIGLPFGPDDFGCLERDKEEE